MLYLRKILGALAVKGVDLHYCRGCKLPRYTYLLLEMVGRIRLCMVDILGLEAGEGFGGVVKGVIDAFAAEEESVTQFHVHASSILQGR